jgi:hypothetical protein
MNRTRLASLLRRPALSAALVVCAIGTGCGSGGQTGGEQPVTSPVCQPVYENLGLDTPTPLGVTPASVLEPVLGTSSSPLLWSANTGSLTLGPEQGLSQLELGATYEGGSIAWAHFEPHSDAPAGTSPALLGCPIDRLEIELGVRLRTEGGALDERFVATLGAPAAGDAQLSTRLALDSLEGSFFVTAPAGVSTPALQLNAVWDVFGFRGTLLGEVSMERRDPSGSGGTVSFGLVPFAEWPPPAGSEP